MTEIDSPVFSAGSGVRVAVTTTIFGVIGRFGGDAGRHKLQNAGDKKVEIRA